MTRRWLPLSLATLMLVVGVAFVVLWTRTPADCTATGPAARSWATTGVVVELAGTCPANGTQLRDGDLVTAVDGHALADGPAGRTWTVGEQVEYTVGPDGEAVPVTLVDPSLGGRLAPAWTALLFVGSLLAIAVYVAWRRLDAATSALLFFASGLAASTMPTMLGVPVIGVLSGPLLVLFIAATQLAYVIGWAGAWTFILLFPRPFARLANRPRVIRWAVYAAPVIIQSAWAAAAAATSAGVADWVGRLIVGTSLVTVATLLSLIGFTVRRLYQRFDAVQRQQMRWLAGGGILSTTSGLAGWFVPEVLVGQGLPTQLIGLAGLPFVICLAVALLKFRLFDLAVVLHRGLVYGLLTAGVAALYFAAVAVSAGAFGFDTTAPAAIVATAVVAVAVNPLRLVLQRAVDRLMYGDRNDPYSALSRLGRRLDAVADQRSLLNAVADDIADALRVPYVEIEVAGGRTATGLPPDWLPATNGLLDIPLAAGADPIGRLRVSPRAPGASFSRADRRLIDDLTRRVSAAAREVSLRSDLQRSRERLVLAREEERRVLRRALHDEFGPLVAGLSLRTEAARRLVDSDPEAAAATLGAVRSDADELVSDIRRLAYDLRPPALDELGLAEALRLHARSFNGVQIAVYDDGVEQLPAAVEAAAYRIAAEAMINVSRHAAATHCDVHLSVVDGTLTVTVVDNGRGLPADFRAGVGVSAMRERAEELGGSCRVERDPAGGTAVRAALPAGGGAA
ncbi:MAG TPA: histidine kinase [Jiangellaceae bacterium]